MFKKIGKKFLKADEKIGISPENMNIYETMK